MDESGYSNIYKFISSCISYEKLINRSITHAKYGTGKITNVSTSEFTVDYEWGEIIFPFNHLKDKHSFINLDINGLEEFFAKEEEVKSAKQEFHNLKEKYDALSYKEASPFDNLYIILMKIDKSSKLEEDDINFLSKKHLFGTLTIYHKKRYEKTKNPWELINASKYCRRNNNPSVAIELTDYLLKNYSDGNELLLSSILTTRGGAFRDILDLANAEKCAKDAIQYRETYHPYNLLGAIYWQKGGFEEGAEYFERALKLGSKEKLQETLMKSAIEKSGSNKTEIAIKLYKLDSKKYYWTKEYFSNSEYMEYVFKDVVIDV